MNRLEAWPCWKWSRFLIADSTSFHDTRCNFWGWFEAMVLDCRRMSNSWGGLIGELSERWGGLMAELWSRIWGRFGPGLTPNTDVMNKLSEFSVKKSFCCCCSAFNESGWNFCVYYQCIDNFFQSLIMLNLLFLCKLHFLCLASTHWN